MKFDNRETLSYMAFHGMLEKTISLIDQDKNRDKDKKSEFLKLNLSRLNRIYKTCKISNKITQFFNHIEQTQIWLVITEPWCGDSAQTLPIMAKIAEASAGKIQLKIVLRDQNLDIMDQYLSNGSRSIPKLIAYDLYGNDLFTWGPRPKPAQHLFDLWKLSKDLNWDEFEMNLHKWYTYDKGETFQSEIFEKIQFTHLTYLKI